MILVSLTLPLDIHWSRRLCTRNLHRLVSPIASLRSVSTMDFCFLVHANVSSYGNRFDEIISHRTVLLSRLDVCARQSILP